MLWAVSILCQGVAPHSDVSPLVVEISVVFTSVRTGPPLGRRGTELERLPRNYSSGIRERSFNQLFDISTPTANGASNSVSCSAVGDKFHHDGNGIFLTGFNFHVAAALAKMSFSTPCRPLYPKAQSARPVKWTVSRYRRERAAD